jgi:effector-binding domain-containing protein
MTAIEVIMIDAPEIIDVPAQLIAVLPVTVARDKIKDVMGPGIQELMAALQSQGIAPTGPWFTHHLRRPTDTFDFEIGIPVASPVAATGRVKPSQRAAMRAARTLYRGAYEGLASAWGEFMDWIIANGHTRAPDLWECYLTGPEAGQAPENWTTELTQPLVAR